jgi:hypothetical protein
MKKIEAFLKETSRVLASVIPETAPIIFFILLAMFGVAMLTTTAHYNKETSSSETLWAPVAPPPGYRAAYKCFRYDHAEITCFAN